MEKRYYVESDYQGGEFAMYRAYTIEQWRKQAIEWCYADDNYGIMKEIYEIDDDKVLDDIAEIWQVEFAEMKKPKFKETWNDYDRVSLKQFFEERYVEEEE